MRSDRRPRVLSVRRSRRRPSRKSFASVCPRAGVEANGPSGPPSISGNGRYVVFASAATNLVAGDTNARRRHLPARPGHRRRRHLRRGRRRGHDAHQPRPERGAGRRGRARYPVITAGRPLRGVRLARPPTWSPARTAGTAQVYRLDRTTGAIVRVSESAAGRRRRCRSLGAPADQRRRRRRRLRSRGATNLVTHAAVPSPAVSYVRDITADGPRRISPLRSCPARSAAGSRTMRRRSRQTASRVAYYRAHERVGLLMTPTRRRSYVARPASTQLDDVRLRRRPSPVAIAASRRRSIASSAQSADVAVVRLVVDTGAETRVRWRPVRHSGSLPSARRAHATRSRPAHGSRLRFRHLDEPRLRAGRRRLQRRRPLAGRAVGHGDAGRGRHQRRRRRVRHRSARRPRRRRRHDGRPLGDAVRRDRPGGGSGRRRPDERAGGGCRHAPERADPAVPGRRRDRHVLPHEDRASPIPTRRRTRRPS